MRKQVIAYLHTHWDREWYREFEVFRARLLRVFDNILYMLETNKIPCFYFDGQVSALEDYLEIRPEKRDLVRSLIYSKKLFIGPFYCLVDEFLTDKTCFRKNLEIGMKYAIELGCTDFIGYLPDTFGHSVNVPDILMEFGIDKCVVWRGCGDFPAEFKWCGIDTVNLVRGYFQDILSSNIAIEEKAKILKKELDLISEKSGLFILLPIGADHLGVPVDIQDQITAINELLKDDYNIKLGSPFDYFKNVKSNFEKFKFDDELRDNSKTFILQGVYSSRLDLKRLNTECMHKLSLAGKYIKFTKTEKQYEKLLNYAYKLLLQNQAHDSICGCSTDEVHEENTIRFKKILQIANTIIAELKLETKFEPKMIINLSDKFYSGIIEFETTEKLSGYEFLSERSGFPQAILADTLKIPITEDYTKIYTYLAEINNVEPNETEFIMPESSDSDLMVSENSIENSNIVLKIEDKKLYVNNIPFSLVDYTDYGDSYNFGPKEDDKEYEYSILRTKVLYSGQNRAKLKIDFEGVWDVIPLVVTLDKHSEYIKFEFDWENSQKNHLLEARFSLKSNIKTVYSEDMDTLIKRSFNPEYDIRKNLPKIKGKEAKTNTAPMQRGLLIDEKDNNIGIITKGLTQYEIYKNMLYLPLLRATGMISNPLNPARTTPAGPPIETPALQMMKNCKAEFNIFFGNENAFNNVLSLVYSDIIV